MACPSEETLALSTKAPGSPTELAELKSGLARALPASESARARQLASEAREVFEHEKNGQELELLAPLLR